VAQNQRINKAAYTLVGQKALFAAAHVTIAPRIRVAGYRPEFAMFD
jgi:hypothetical protein